ncbi:MAG: phenylalanine--tRNA ligase subunit alpha, partial [Gammaproteobacteria bacterium]|nr:phenylalanine--tRNA ligase subunit alpha [Gammaproteobacteria bacterium]
MSELTTILASANQALDAAADLNSLDQIRVRYLGKKGELTQLLKTLGTLPPEQRRDAGQAINQAK